jgi:hypothetical protein
MRTINRAALLVRPKEPYLAWAANLDDKGESDAWSLRGHTSVYLVAEDPEERDESAPLELYYQEIFESELASWHTDESVWPPTENLETFLSWFDVEAQSLVFDLEDTLLDVTDNGDV